MPFDPGAPDGATHAAALLPVEAFEALEQQARLHHGLNRRVTFEGEVTDVRSREILVAAGDWSFAVRVGSPALQDVRFGDWIRAHGSLTLRVSPREASLHLFLANASVQRLGRSRRAEALTEAIRRFARTCEEARRLDWVAHLAIVGTQGHGLRDVIATLERAGLTHSLYEADFSDASSIAAAIQRASNDGRVATLVTRGGGSRMELEPVNSVDVAAAARASRAFTVLAVGHQSDVFDVECAFDRSFGTPSKGASFFAALARRTRGPDSDEASRLLPPRTSAAPPSRRRPSRRPFVLLAVGVVAYLVVSAYSAGHRRGYAAGQRECFSSPASVPAARPATSAPRSPTQLEVSP